MKTKNVNVTLERGDENGNQPNHNSTAAQRNRILNWLRKRPLTTLQARFQLDVLHPAARIMELRNSGMNIDTVWVRDENGVGRLHRVAKYTLKSGV